MLKAEDRLPVKSEPVGAVPLSRPERAQLGALLVDGTADSVGGGVARNESADLGPDLLCRGLASSPFAVRATSGVAEGSLPPGVHQEQQGHEQDDDDGRTTDRKAELAAYLKPEVGSPHVDSQHKEERRMEGDGEPKWASSRWGRHRSHLKSSRCSASVSPRK